MNNAQIKCNELIKGLNEISNTLPCRMENVEDKLDDMIKISEELKKMIDFMVEEIEESDRIIDELQAEYNSLNESYWLDLEALT